MHQDVQYPYRQKIRGLRQSNRSPLYCGTLKKMKLIEAILPYPFSKHISLFFFFLSTWLPFQNQYDKKGNPIFIKVKEKNKKHATKLSWESH